VAVVEGAHTQSVNLGGQVAQDTEEAAASEAEAAVGVEEAQERKAELATAETAATVGVRAFLPMVGPW
jgi:hypothetical protein